ncbi:MAG: glycosyltransferase family 2 protein [Anaerolineaceae bacterium]|nr:glycosyltransferase family 2 protein [Anaerolineaceae bacterium]
MSDFENIDFRKAKIAVVIPAYRVENQIQKVLLGIPEYVDLIIVVNDASPDDTQEKVVAIRDPRIYLINHPQNQGVGSAMRSGYAYALSQNASIIVKVDGDDQMDLGYLPYLIEPILNNEADYTKGNRFLHQVELKQMPLLRRIGNYGLTFMTKLASGYWNIFDPTNGYTAIRAAALAEIPPEHIANNYFFETSMLCELRVINAVVKDIAIPARYQTEKSSVNIPREFFVFLINLTKRSFHRILTRYFLFDFTAASLYFVIGTLLGLFGIVWGIVKWVASAETKIPASTGTVLLAVLPIILSVQLLIQAIAQDIDDIPSKVQRFTPTRGSQELWKKVTDKKTIIST